MQRDVLRDLKTHMASMELHAVNRRMARVRDNSTQLPRGSRLQSQTVHQRKLRQKVKIQKGAR